MNDQFDDPLAALKAALEVEPSPEFAARVRTEVDRVRVDRQSWRWAVAIAAVSVVGFAVWVRHDVPPAAGSDLPPQLVAALEPPFGADRALTSISPSPGEAGRSSSPRRLARPDLQLLLPPGQSFAIHQLVQALHEGRVTFAGRSEGRDAGPDDRVIDAISPIEIPLLRIEPIAPEQVVDPVTPDPGQNQDPVADQSQDQER